MLRDRRAVMQCCTDHLECRLYSTWLLYYHNNLSLRQRSCSRRESTCTQYSDTGYLEVEQGMVDTFRMYIQRVCPGQ